MSATHASPDAPSSLRERKKAATRAAIHTTALRLGTERGIAAVTVEEICAEVDIAPRTFFNYYPSKAAAVFDLRSEPVPDAEQDAFVAATGNLIEDVCNLVAPHVHLPAEFRGIKQLMSDQPELRHEFWMQLIHVVKPLLPAMERRTGNAHDARVAMGLVLSALAGAVLRPDPTPGATLATRLHSELRTLRTLLGPS